MFTDIRQWPHSARWFVSFWLCLVGLNYLLLLLEIWLDTRMQVALIAQGYGSFETAELAEHTFKYLFWMIGVWGMTLGIFLLSGYTEKMKRLVAVLVPVFIISDIGSMWFVRFSSWFAAQMFFFGFMLALTFLVLFVLIQWQLWFGLPKIKG